MDHTKINALLSMHSVSFKNFLSCFPYFFLLHFFISYYISFFFFLPFLLSSFLFVPTSLFIVSSFFQSYSKLRWSRGSVLAFSTQVCGFKPGRSRRIFRAKKILSTPSFGGEVKPLVPCRRFAACKRSLNLPGSRNLGKITTGHLSRPQFHLSLLGSLASLRTEAKVGSSKGGGKQ